MGVENSNGKVQTCVIPEYCQALREVDWSGVDDLVKRIFETKLRGNIFPNAQQIRRCTRAYGSLCAINPENMERIHQPIGAKVEEARPQV